MKLKAFEAHFSCGHFAPKNVKIGSVVKKLSPKNRGVGIKLADRVYISLCVALKQSVITMKLTVLILDVYR